MTEVEPTNTSNGAVDGLSEEEQERLKMRPPDIDADVREMERRKRVDAIMNSKIFREELEKIIEFQMKESGGSQAGIAALQQISDLIGVPGGRASSAYRAAGCVIPIADIRGMESVGFSKGEKMMRCKVAALFRVIDILGWSQGVYNHVTARISQDLEHFLINPFGMLYHEITASSLLKVDMQGNVLDSGTTNMGMSVAGYTLHSAIHAARPDIRCIIHVHVPSVVAISALKCGLLPVSQESCLIGDVSYHEYQGLFIDVGEKEQLVRDLGPVNKVLLLRNHGAVCCGGSVEEAFEMTRYTILACESQARMMPLGLENLVLISDEARQRAYEAAHNPEDIVNTKSLETRKERKFKFGEMDFEALMRMLDNAGYRTGYMYKHPLVRAEPAKPKSDVEVPPASSSSTYIFDEEDLFKFSPLKRILDGRKSNDKTRWLNSPNVYQKVEVLETGTPDPKKITKWVADASPTHSTPIKVDNNLQFVPKNTNTAEFKKLQKQIKENRRAGGLSAGPQSNLLEGVSWDEARQLQDASMSATGDQVVMVGAASKGIIQRDFQHHAVVFKSPYSKNPFDQITDEELDEYKKIVERKQRGEPEEGFAQRVDLSSDTEAEVTQPSLPGETTLNGDDVDAHHSTVSQSSKEGSPTKDTSASESTKEKKKKKGLRTPSFLKKKKKDKKKKKEAAAE